MIKKHFQKEIEISGTQSRTGANVSKEVSKIQSWLNLYAFSNPNLGITTNIDGDFGPATEKAVKNYQAAKGHTANGVVTKQLFEEMSNVMKVAFTQPIPGSGLRELVVNAAKMHLNAAPRELVIKGQSNSGPWVRAYMDGNEGKDWLWCMGFVQTVLDQATSQIGQQFTDIVKRSFSCDTVAIYAKQKNNFISYSSVRKTPSLVKPGDIFLLQSNKNSNDWIHTGLILGVNDEVFETIEGNTNADGSENGYGVLRRSRNFMKSKLDIIRIV
ncbi:hypothetical protein GCM10022217_37530 [Chryseobacterium ginsenosidimutans]|uniref:peptidoglycan-binding protein n=1 Tax=Chryseobacterium ginsenosidimutans TaxID=687846 RepID=UPI0031DAABB7